VNEHEIPGKFQMRDDLNALKKASSVLDGTDEVLSTGKQYNNKVIDFKEYTKMRVSVEESMITARRLDIVIPKGVANRQQLEALLKLRRTVSTTMSSSG